MIHMVARHMRMIRNWDWRDISSARGNRSGWSLDIRYTIIWKAYILLGSYGVYSISNSIDITYR